jgi:predicted  nucleic acid-binding Zn-ribbon protein
MTRIIAIASIVVIGALLAGCVDKQAQQSENDIAQLQQQFVELESRVDLLETEIVEIKNKIEEIEGEVGAAADADEVEKIQGRVEVLEGVIKRLRATTVR